MKLSPRIALTPLLVLAGLQTASAAETVTRIWLNNVLPGPTSYLTSDIAVDNIGNCFITGREVGPAGSRVFVQKFDLTGTAMYPAPNFLGAAGEIFEPGEVVIDGAGNAVFCATRTSGGNKQIFVRKVNPAGATLWTHDYGTTGNESAVRMVLTENSGFAVGGFRQSAAGDDDFLLLKINSAGGQLFMVTFPLGPGNDYPVTLSKDAANNFFLCGSSPLAGQGQDVVAVKFTPAGGVMWQKRLNSPLDTDDLFGGAAVDAAGNLVIAANMVMGPTQVDVVINKFGPAGAPVWQRIYNSPDSKNDASQDLTVEGSGFVYLGGASQNAGNAPLFLGLKYAPDGTPVFASRIGPMIPGSFSPTPGARYVGADRWGYAYLSGGAIPPNGGREDMTTVKLDATTGSPLQMWTYNHLLAPQPNTEYTPSAMAVHHTGDVYMTGPFKDIGAPQTGIDTYRLRQGAIANPETYHMLRSTVFSKTAATGIKTNDRYATRSNCVLVANVTHGTLNLFADGSFNYTPTNGFSGDDSFTYRLVEGPFTSNTTTVAFRIHPAVNLLTVTPNNTGGGNPTVGKVTMSGPAPVSGTQIALTSANPGLASVPASALVLPGNNTVNFPITTTPVNADTSVALTASRDGLSVTGTVFLKKTALALMTVTPSSLVGGNSATGRAELNGPAPAGGKTVTLSDNTSAMSEPASVAIAAGAKSNTFTVTTSPVSAAVTRQVMGTLDGVTKAANVTLNPPTLDKLSFSPTTVKGGDPSTGTVALTGPAYAGGIVVSLSSSSVVILVPASVTVPFNVKTDNFVATTKAVTATTARSVTATLGAVSRTAILTLTP